jgi:hypothetical protein
MQALANLQATSTKWLEIAKSLEANPTAKSEEVRFAFKKAFLDSTDLAESFWNYSRLVIQRPLKRDGRAKFADFFTHHQQYKMLQAARGSWKSSLSIDYATWRVAREHFLTGESKLRILFASEVLELAKRNVQWVRQTMSWNKAWIDLFGDHRPDSRKDSLAWGKTELTSKYRIDPRIAEATVSSMGQSSERTGFHFDLIICDDLEAERSSASRDMIENVWDFYRLLHSILDPHGEMVIICTRWHDDDIYARIEEENEESDDEEKFEILKIPAKNEDGTLNFPSILSDKKLATLRKKQGTYIWSCQYLLQPTPDEDRIFKEKWLKTVQPVHMNHIKNYPVNIYTTADFAWYKVKKADFKRGEVRRDYTVVSTWAVDDRENVFLLDWFREKCERWASFQEIYRQKEKWKSSMVCLQVFDRAGLEESLEQFGRYHSKILWPQFISYPSDQDKVERIRTLVQPKFENGQVFLQSNMLGWFKQDEYLDFPKARHDDFFDCICNIYKVAKPAPQTRANTPLTEQQDRIAKLKAGINPYEDEEDWTCI